MESLAIIIHKLNGGGAERVASNLSIELSNKYRIVLIVFDGSNMTYPYSGILYDLQLPAQRGLIRKVLTAIKRIYLVRRIKKRENVTCSISLLDGPNLVNLLSRTGDRVIVSIRNYLSHERVGLLRRLTIKFVCKHSNRIISISKNVKNDLVSNFNIPPEKISVIYNSCDGDRLIRLAEDGEYLPVDFMNGHNYIVTAGRLTEQKGHWHLLRAFKEVVTRRPNSRLIILGDGELRDALVNLSKELGIDEHVIFAGYVRNPHGIIKRCDVFAFSSLYEGLGNVLLEALAMGKAIVSTDCDAGPREILAPITPCGKKTDSLELGEFGILVPVGTRKWLSAHDPLTKDETCLAEAICLLLENKELRRAYEEKAVLRSYDFSPDKITKLWQEVIDDQRI